jgi:hypothetical protein
MSDSLLTILEMIEEEMARSVQIQAPPTQDGEEIGYMKSKEGIPQASAGLLNVKRIVDAIVSTTESETADKDQSIAESFNILRSFNQDKLNNISDAQTLNDAIVSFYQNTSNNLQPNCRDFSTLTKRALINAAYSKILNDFNASAAGFVNEAYLANLLGGDADTIPAGQSKIDGRAGGKPYNNIADLQFNGMGISLKTKQKGVSGSLSDLLVTLGIPFQMGSRASLVTEPQYSKLFYVIFGKNQSAKDYFDISTALITKEAVEGFLRKSGIRKTNDGLWNIKSDKVTALEKSKQFLLGYGKMYAKMSDVGGVAQFANKQIEFKPNTEFNSLQAEKLGEELTRTLNTLNSYIAEIEKTIVRYAAEPTVGNLQTLQKSLEMLSDFEIGSIISC